MKKLFLLLIALMFVTWNTNAQNRQLIVGKNYVNPNETTLVAQKSASTVIKFDLNELNLTDVVTNYGNAVKMSSTNAPVMMEAGFPELIYLPTAIVLPDFGSAELSITYGEYTDFENIEVAPSKGNLKRSVDPSTIPYVKGEVYNIDAFFPGNLAALNETFIMRDVRGTTIFAYPVQYNPVTKILRIYSEMTITVNYIDEPGENEFTQKRRQTVDPTFNKIYNNMFINNASFTKGYPTGEEGDLLIIAHPDFMEAMQPYVNWKRTIGRKTTIVPVTEAGTTAAAIKSYISAFYNNPENDLAYVLLVGNLARIPTQVYPNVGGNQTLNPTVGTDHFYGQLVGSDRYLEVLVGRFSAENVAQVQTQVQRSIWYERDITTADTWLGTGIAIAYNEGGSQAHDGQENDYVHMNNIRNRMLTYGYNPVHQEYGGNCPGVPNTNAAQMSQRFNAGASMTNFINHGHVQSWSVGSYNSSHVNALQNAGKLSYIFSVACLNGRMLGLAGSHNSTCFAETWMRASQNNQPTGAVATLMATISIGWGPPMTTQDEFVNICMGITSAAPGPPAWTYGLPGQKKTFAGAALNATQAMLMRHGANTDNGQDFDSWLVFGDPTLMIRTQTPQEMTVSYLPFIPFGATEFSVECDVDGALAVISYMDENNEVIILGTGVVEGGVAEIVFYEPISILDGTLNLAITGFNKVTYIAPVEILSNRPFISVSDHKLSINSIPTNHCVFGETIDFSMLLKNRTPMGANNVYVTLSMVGKDDFVQIIQPSTPISVLNGQDSVWVSGRQLVISTDIPNRYNVEILATITYSDTLTLEHTFNLLGAAPEFVISGFTTDETNGTFLITNVGLEPISSTTVELSNQGSTVAAVSNFFPTTANFTIGTPIPFTFDLQKAPDLPEFVTYSLGLSIAKGNFLYERTLRSAFGILVEDFERGFFHDSLWWSDEGKSANFEWYIDSLQPFEGDYCMRSKKISHNEVASMITREFGLLGGDSIVFYYKVSSEDCRGNSNCVDGGDALRFSISDGQTWTEVAAYYGEIPWTRAAFPVVEGKAFFQWAYTKNPTQNRGNDAAWVDYIVFPKLMFAPNVTPVSITPPVTLPDHIVFDVIVNDGHLQARINVETPGKATIRLFNMLGQPVGLVCNNSAVHVGQNDFYFDLSNLPRGTYICTYFDGKRQLSRKIVW